MTQRRAIGIEIDPTYCALAVQRIREFLHSWQHTLFRDESEKYAVESIGMDGVQYRQGNSCAIR